MDPAPALVHAARHGDRAAFAALYDLTHRAVFLYVLGILGHTEDAEDTTHAAYLRAWSELPSLRHADRFAPWLFRIARNAARDLLRRGRPHAPLPAGLPARVEREARPLADLLDGLDPETRALVVLRHGLGFPVEQVASLLDTSPPTVRRHLARAVEHLRLREIARSDHGR
jgi:RNA polymerase sigma-70 factor (ECF subfamily)